MPKQNLQRMKVRWPVVAMLMKAHEAKRILWFPSEILNPPPDEDPDRHLKQLRKRAEGISPAARVALALNLLTEEGLPHFHRLLAVYLGTDSIWAKWNNLWTAEEVESILGADDARLFNRVYGVDRGPNFADPHHGTGQPDKNILFLPRPPVGRARGRQGHGRPSGSWIIFRKQGFQHGGTREDHGVHGEDKNCGASRGALSFSAP